MRSVYSPAYQLKPASLVKSYLFRSRLFRQINRKQRLFWSRRYFLFLAMWSFFSWSQCDLSFKHALGTSTRSIAQGLYTLKSGTGLPSSLKEKFFLLSFWLLAQTFFTFCGIMTKVCSEVYVTGIAILVCPEHCNEEI